METFSALLALCAGNSPVTGEFPSQRAVTRSFDVFFDLLLNKRLGKQPWGWWFEPPPSPLWRHCNVMIKAQFECVHLPLSHRHYFIRYGDISDFTKSTSGSLRLTFLFCGFQHRRYLSCMNLTFIQRPPYFVSMKTWQIEGNWLSTPHPSSPFY